MAEKEWFRNSDWNTEIEIKFRERLRRARLKSQYLRIQACYLRETHPLVALDLLDEYFSLGDDFDMAQAYVDKAVALLALGREAEALETYEAAIERERQFPNLRTVASSSFAWLVIRTKSEERYIQALQIIQEKYNSLIFPSDKYRFSGARALLLEELGQIEAAKDAAKLAMAAALETKAPFKNHPRLGLVHLANDEFDHRIAKLASQTERPS